MECPIKNHAVETGTYRGKASTRDCCKEVCAWWVGSLDCCAMTAIAINTYNMALIDRGSFAKYTKEE